MRTTRSLVLKRETLSELSAGELAVVHAGSHLCVTEICGHGASFDTPCPTTPINVCLKQITTAIDLRSLDCPVINTVDC